MEARNRFTWLNRAEIEWVPVRGGRFQVGSTFPIRDERPMQWINISAFEVSISEVTNAQYKRCVDASTQRLYCAFVTSLIETSKAEMLIHCIGRSSRIGNVEPT